MANNEKSKKKTNKNTEVETNAKKGQKNNSKNETKKSEKQTKEKKTTNKKTESKQTNKKEKKVTKPSKESVAAEKQIEKTFSKNSELVKLIKIVAIVTAVMLVFYLITLVATNKADEVNNENKETEEQETKTAIQYDYIMIGTMLNKEGTYYVLIEEDGDNRLSEYDTLIQTAGANEDAPSIYKANLTDSFNKGYLSKEANYDVDNISDFRVTGTTLVKVVDGSIDEVFDTYDTIKNKLTELAE